jgi:hypothetical protein
LQALKDGNITPQEFLNVNAQIGSWKDPGDMVQEGPPFPSPPPPAPPSFGPFDPWSSRNMQLSSDGGATPAPRREGDLAAMHAAYNRGLYFDGDIDIPLIDWRHYLEEELDMHNSHQSFAARQRLPNRDGDASNQVIRSLFTPSEALADALEHHRIEQLGPSAIGTHRQDVDCLFMAPSSGSSIFSPTRCFFLIHSTYRLSPSRSSCAKTAARALS